MMNRNYFDFDLFDDMFGDPFFAPRRNHAAGNHRQLANFPEKRSDRGFMAMQTDIEKKDNGYELSMELPGFDKKDISVEIKNGYLTISAEKTESKDEKDKEGKNYVHRERYYGKCSRSFYVGNGINQDNIKASYNDGVLKLSIPEAVEEQKKLISVE